MARREGGGDNEAQEEEDEGEPLPLPPLPLPLPPSHEMAAGGDQGGEDHDQPAPPGEEDELE